ncbi:MAG TPA: asparagine synthase (glutamine-hydrolyzing) [Phycisphaerae bacterium]|nr:asparagine synthase (glutamine-hydrolyzing) [Phycisphaerae bacterium]
MCGIVGIVSSAPLSLEDRSARDEMAATLAHRGPDGFGRHDAPNVALGHRRLAVIDVTGGGQPLSNETASIWAVANGEFYNFRELRDDLASRGHIFRTASDTECLVHLYEEHGDRCVDRLAGMFAFAVWDEPRRRLLVARDRLGVKPLYYCLDDDRLLFSSELKSLLAARVRAEFDPTALADYLTYSFIPSPRTIFTGIHKLPPGSLLTYQNGRVTVRPYWDLAYQGLSDRPLDELADSLWENLQRATSRRLVSDVPVAAFLSGGLDSTAVAWAMTKTSRAPVVTLTCGFDEKDFDERAKARTVAALLGTDHHDAIVRPQSVGWADTLCEFFDEPFADASAIPTYQLSQFAKRYATVLLSGDGGDEILAGYRRYRFDRYEGQVRKLVPSSIRRAAFGAAARLYPDRSWLPRPLRARATLANLSVDAATAHALSISTLRPDDVRRLLNPDVAAQLGDYDPLEHSRGHYHGCDAPDHLSKCQYADIRLGLADGILTKVDRASMAHAVEVRSPMLDHEFVQFAWSIPPRMRIRGRAGKWPLRSLLSRRLDPAIASQSKAGFEVPLDAWFKGPLRAEFESRVLARNSACQDWFDASIMKQFLAEHLSGRRRHGPTLWKLLMFEAWHDRYLKSTRRVAPPHRVLVACP